MSIMLLLASGGLGVDHSQRLFCETSQVRMFNIAEAGFTLKITS